MIHLNIEGKSWPEVTEQLVGLIRNSHQPCDDGAAMAETISELRADLEAAGIQIDDKNIRIKKLLTTIKEKDARIFALEKQLSEMQETPAENPTTAAEPEPETNSSADASETDTAPEDAPAPATTTEQPKYDKVQVREFLAGCREKGVNITDVLKPFGGRFPAVKEEDYPALMEAAKKALAEKGAK